MGKYKVYNGYAGLGGNRKLWEDVEVTAVEIDPEIAKIYQDFFPDDTVIVGDAHQYLLEHYKEFDLSWTSPPCPSHSDIRHFGAQIGKYDAIYPDRKLWEEIILLQHYAKGKFVVENVRTYYKPFVAPNVILDRHYFWTNFYINPNVKFPKREELHDKMTGDSKIFGIELTDYDIKNKRQLLRNMVNPEVANYILQTAREEFPPVVDLFDNDS